MNSLVQSIIVIPARFDSTRFPGKPLALIKGISLIQRVWQIAMQCQKAEEVYIATDSDQIASHVRNFGGSVIMTAKECSTGTERVAQAMRGLADKDSIVVGLQGDAVLTPPWVIDEMIDTLRADPSLPIVTPAISLRDQQLTDFLAHKKISPTSGTTVVFDKNKKALYFSKQVLPFCYPNEKEKPCVYRHIGLYAYRYYALKQFCELLPSSLEKQEKLEQLRALENGISITVKVVDYRGRSHGSIDTHKDVKEIESIIEREGELVAC